MACEDCDSNPAEMSPDEQTSVTLGTHSPITGELRDVYTQTDAYNTVFHTEDFDRCCDAIDAVHANLERENDELRMKFVNANRHALHLERENESLKAELDRVLGEGVPMTDENMAAEGWVRKDKGHVISHATVEVTPHIDWLRMADELDEFVEIVRGMAGGAK